LNQPIPNSDLNEWGLLGEIADAYDNFDETICQDLIKDTSEEGVSADQFNKIKTALKNSSLNIDNVYRLAFLVVSIKQNPKSSPDDSFWFHKDSANNDKHAPIIIAFKIPDFATNGSNSLAYRDTAHLTAKALRSEEQEAQAHLITEEKRDGFLNDVARRQEDVKQNIHIEDLVIDCRGMSECQDGRAEDVALKQAVIDIINGSANSCSDVGPFEKAGDIFTYSQVNPEGRELATSGGYNDPFSKNFNPSKNPEFEWGLIFNSVSSANEAIEPELTIRAHIVAPIGADIDYINGALRVFFDDAGYNQMIDNNCVADSGQCGLIPEYYTLVGGVLDLKSDRPDKEFHDPDDLECRTVSREFPVGSGIYTDVEECGPKKKEFGVALKESGGELYFPGASLGWHVRKIQESLRPIGSKAHSYVTSCERTEDLFLGRCPGGDYQEIEYDAIVSSYEGGICSQIDSSSQLFRECVICESKDAIWTSLGCVNTQGRSIVEMIMSIGLSTGGGISLIMILISGFQLSISQGDPKKIEDAKSRLTAAIIGLLFIVFSIVILQFVGVKILRIPGFGE
jgi:type IV secretion system pilin